MRRRRLPPALRLASRLKLGASIRKARRAAGLTQEALGRRLGLKGRAIYRWERNDAAPNGHHRRALIREIYLFSTAAGLQLQAAISELTGKQYTVVGASSNQEPAPPTPRDTSTSPFIAAPQLQPSAATQPANDLLDVAILKMADELDIAPRRARRALSRLLQRLRSANFQLGTLEVELDRLLTVD